MSSTCITSNSAYQNPKKVSKASNKVIIFIVYISLLLDNILLTVVVPIIPDYLYNLEHNGSYLPSNGTCLDACADFASETSKEKAENESNDKASYNISPKTNSSNMMKWKTCSCGLQYSSSNETGAAHYIPEDIINENAKVGLLFSSKALVQLITNSFMGMIISRIGYHWPLVVGNFSIMVSSVVFAYSSSYALMFVARSLQGIGSACIAVSGLSIIADRYPDDETRSEVMGIAMGGIAMGVLVGYPFGGLLYDFVGKMTPFLIIASLCLLNAGFQLVILELTIGSQHLAFGSPPYSILKDPHVWIITGAVCLSTSAMAILEPCLPIWLMDTIMPKKWQLGTVFIPDSIGYLFGTTLFGVIAIKIGRWLVAVLSLIVVGFSCMMITWATQMAHLIVPHFFLGFGIGIVDSTLMPLLAYIFDTRHTAEYGSIYAIAQVAVSLAYFLGPLIGSQVVKQIGFPWLMITVGIINIIYSPLCIFLRNVNAKEETQAIILNSAQMPKYDADYPQMNVGNVSKYKRFSCNSSDSD